MTNNQLDTLFNRSVDYNKFNLEERKKHFFELLHAIPLMNDTQVKLVGTWVTMNYKLGEDQKKKKKQMKEKLT